MGPNDLPLRSAALVMALVAALLLLRLGAVPLLGPDEPRYARVAVEMSRNGDLVTPTLQGQPWLEKPPLYYWLAGFAFAFLGETEAAARLPSVLAGLLFVGATALVGARLYGRAAGLHAGIILGTTLLTFAYGRAAAMDMLLAATLTAALGLIALRLLRIAGALAIPAAYVFMALATLAKGPLGFLLPGLVVTGYVVWSREWGAVRRARSPIGIALFLAVAAPWYLLVYGAQGQAFIDVFILNHNVQRFTSTIHHHDQPFYFYLLILLGGLFPWTGLALPAVGGLHALRVKSDRFLLLWFLLPFLFFSAAGSKLPGYILPCLSPLAILMGRAADEMTRDRAWTWPWERPVALLGLALGSLAVAGPLWLWRQGEPYWMLALPSGLWALIVTFTISRRLALDPPGTLRLWRVGAAGLLLLIAGGAPPVLARLQSGRDLFIPTMGREVVAWGAWRNAWMAGYFYNDGKVREAAGLPEILKLAEQGPVLVLCGPSERRRMEMVSTLKSRVLAEGPRENALLRVEAR